MSALPIAELRSTDQAQKGGAAPATLIIGAGIAGIQAALDIANAGFQVYLVERSSSIGGHMAQLDKTFPTLDCSSCILTPKMADISRNPNIKLLTCADVLAIEGDIRNFHVSINQRPRYVDVDSCTGCGLCAEACPVTIPSPFNENLSTQKAIYRRFPQAIPAAFVIEKRPSPCKITCPADIPVQGYVALIAEGKFHQALERVRQAGVPFVGTLGRVCYHPCESACKRADWDEAVSICALKRFAYDEGEDGDLPAPLPVQWEEKVVIVGAGPAGLTAAYELARRGYRATVFDALPVAGGMLSVGIPAYRLPRPVLEHEIDYIRALGVDIRLGTPVGRDGGPSVQELLSQYNAVFLAVGAHRSSRLNIPGEDSPGVLQALTFLRDLNLGQPVDLGKQVAVIGGGNSAIDAARCALRLGSQVQILYRRTRTEMPAAPWEVDAAQAEGVELNFLIAPLKILEQAGKIVGIECQRMELGEPDASGRRRPVPIPGSELTVPVDTVIAAIGQSVAAEELGVQLNRDRLVADPLTLQTPLPGVFAGGDAVIGPASVVEAVGAGIRAAESIHRYLRNQDLSAGRLQPQPNPQDIHVEPFSPVRRAARAHMPELPLDERLGNFKEVELGFSAEQAVQEAQRCLSCAVCSECLQCVPVCQCQAIHHDEVARQIDLQVDAIVVATGFEPFDARLRPEMGYGKYPQVITTVEFERLASASGPTSGKIRLNGREPRKIVFIQCVGSRDRSLSLGEGGNPYCSRVCCMVVAKQAHLAHDRLPSAEITVFYMDVRAFGKGFEEFYDRVRNEGVIYRRGMPSEIIRKGENLLVRAEDTLLGEPVEVEADLVVLAVGMTPDKPDGAADVANLLNLERSADGFFQENHPKLRVVESNQPGVFLAGCCQGPKDIPDTVAHAKAAASAAMILMAEKGAGHASG